MNELPPPPPPGIVIHYQAAASGCYIGSPSIVALPDGKLVASHDLFGPKTDKKDNVVLVYGSSDKGLTWQPLALVRHAFWSGLFVHRGVLYLMGTSGENGHVAIRRSDDGGRTWTQPVDQHTGLLTPDGLWHTAPMPVVVHRGRLWRAFEDMRGGQGWGVCFRAHMLSAPEDANLLEASNWTISEPLARDASWLGNTFGGWLEGNAVVTPAGDIVDILRVHQPAQPEKAAIVHIAADGKGASFDPATDFVDLPGGSKKFSIKPDPRGGGYWTLANWVPPHHVTNRPDTVRNTQALLHSTDLRHWTLRSVLFYHPDPQVHAWQYLDWQFDGDDLIVVAR
ncbi:MAG: exo-alpha-sialidase, partial [Armatimonadetes bacterium]|nr:exo-alpha-sialidase [Armatimonadota bacterium]